MDIYRLKHIIADKFYMHASQLRLFNCRGIEIYEEDFTFLKEEEVLQVLLNSRNLLII